MISGNLDYLPSGFAMWPAGWQAAALFFSTFVLEDVAAIGAGLLLAAGALTWPLAFLACFLGIWIGDAGLYAAARIFGRGCFERTSLRRFAGRVERSERWFAERGNAILIFSRLLPGARLPTYLAAGFLRVPLSRFLFITGSASLVWTLIVLLAAQVLGTKLFTWLGPLQKTGWAILIGVPLMLGAMRLVRWMARTRVFANLTLRFERWRHWEFWPAWLFYLPVGVYYFWLSLRHRGFLLPTAANPGIFSGGMIGESKMATLQSLMDTSPEFTADAELLQGTTVEERLESLRGICQRRAFAYPFVLKPDLGQRGVGVKLIRSEEQALACLRQTSAPLLAQRYAEGPEEVGVFYYRFPHEARGHIFAITEKIFPAIIGDGHSTIADLIRLDARARFMADKYLARLAGRHDDVLAAGETLKLVEAGNHAQGCIFRDGMRFCTPALIECIDSISQKVDGFFIGRYDLRHSSEDELRAGRNFKIVELNGAASEATSIYDARNSLVSAYRTIFRQWDLVFAIGQANRQRGFGQTSLLLLWQKWREYSRLARTYPAAD